MRIRFDKLAAYVCDFSCEVAAKNICCSHKPRHFRVGVIDIRVYITTYLKWGLLFVMKCYIM